VTSALLKNKKQKINEEVNAMTSIVNASATLRVHIYFSRLMEVCPLEETGRIV